jgi:hypothetical protein
MVFAYLLYICILFICVTEFHWLCLAMQVVLLSCVQLEQSVISYIIGSSETDTKVSNSRLICYVRMFYHSKKKAKDEASET